MSKTQTHVTYISCGVEYTERIKRDESGLSVPKDTRHCANPECFSTPPVDLSAWEKAHDESYYCFDCGRCPVCGHDLNCRQCEEDLGDE